MLMTDNLPVRDHVRLVSILVLDCEWKAQAGNVCIASFDWSCSGICKSVEKLKDVHRLCGEGESAVWSALL
jgi:beta-1,3-galactosyltransferase 1/2/3/4/5/7/8